MIFHRITKRKLSKLKLARIKVALVKGKALLCCLSQILIQFRIWTWKILRRQNETRSWVCMSSKISLTFSLVLGKPTHSHRIPTLRMPTPAGCTWLLQHQSMVLSTPQIHHNIWVTWNLTTWETSNNSSAPCALIKTEWWTQWCQPVYLNCH